MNKKLLAIFIFLLIIVSGCNKEKFYLSDKYYNKGEYVKVTSSDINKKDSYILFTYNNYCSLAVPCENIFLEFMKEYKIDFLSMPYEELKNTYLYKKVKYAPSIIIVDKGEIVDFLDANNDSDLEKYQNVDMFRDWISEYIYLEKE